LPIAASKKSYLMVVAVAQQRFGVMVDELIGQQDIVIKSLGDNFQYQAGISGATDLGNRNTVLVVDILALIEAVISSERRSQFI
jgi:two-component system chemotaxis sensor kinase CheA